VTAAQAGRDYAAQSLEAEQKKLKLGASTSALVLQQQRNMAMAENALISADGGVCEGQGGASAVAVEDAGPVRDQHNGGGDRRDDGDAGDSGADGSHGSGGSEADSGGACRGTVGKRRF